MSKRLQVVLDAEEWQELQNIARRHRMTVSEWVRRTLREAREREPGGDLDAKLRAVRTAVHHEFPAPDIEQMLEETERGYLDAPRAAR
jgi:macrodomain Ter protein organizer (MatP/YcbG family)